MQKSEMFYEPSFPKSWVSCCGVPCPRSHRAVCWLLQGSGGADGTEQDRTHTTAGQWLTCRSVCWGGCFCCACIQTFTHFPHSARTGRRFCLCLLPLTSLCPPIAWTLMFPLPLTLYCIQHPLTSCKSHFLTLGSHI